ncbi:MAG: outer membrane beta-barrel protein [Alistipes ihumii]
MRRFTDKWALLSGIRLETKGMSTKARVKNYAMTMNVSVGDEPGEISGVFTGMVNTKVRNEYITLPVLVLRELSPRWDLRAGLFFSCLIEGGFDGPPRRIYAEGNPVGTKVGVEAASYDFSSDAHVQLGR